MEIEPKNLLKIMRTGKEPVIELLLTEGISSHIDNIYIMVSGRGDILSEPMPDHNRKTNLDGVIYSHPSFINIMDLLIWNQKYQSE